MNGDEIDGGDRDGIASAEAAEIRRLRKENAGLRRANACIAVLINTRRLDQTG